MQSVINCFIVSGVGDQASQKKGAQDQGIEPDKEDGDVEMAEDPSRAEGVLKFEVPNFSKLKETILSDPVIIRNLPW